MSRRCTTHFHACDCREERFAQLEKFAMDVLKSWPHGDLDGADLQRIAVENGMLIERTRAEQCGENCNCEAYASFPLICYEKAEWLLQN